MTRGEELRRAFNETAAAITTWNREDVFELFYHLNKMDRLADIIGPEYRRIADGVFEHMPTERPSKEEDPALQKLMIFAMDKRGYCLTIREDTTIAGIRCIIHKDVLIKNGGFPWKCPKDVFPPIKSPCLAGRIA